MKIAFRHLSLEFLSCLLKEKFKIINDVNVEGLKEVIADIDSQSSTFPE